VADGLVQQLNQISAGIQGIGRSLLMTARNARASADSIIGSINDVKAAQAAVPAASAPPPSSSVSVRGTYGAPPSGDTTLSQLNDAAANKAATGGL
jgi:hypothetical protein